MWVVRLESLSVSIRASCFSEVIRTSPRLSFPNAFIGNLAVPNCGLAEKRWSQLWVIQL